MDYLDTTFATNPLILDTLFDDDFAMDPIILDILLSDDATFSTGSADGDEAFFWTMVLLPLELIAAFGLLFVLWCLIRVYADNLCALARLPAALVYLVWKILYLSVNEQTQTAYVNMIPLPVPFMRSEGKLGGVAASYAPWSLVEKQPRMMLFTKMENVVVVRPLLTCSCSTTYQYGLSDSYEMEDRADLPCYVSHDSVMGPLPVYDPKA